MERSNDSDFLDLRELISIFFRNLWIIVVVALAFGVVGWLVSSYILTPQYTASATVIVNKGPGDAAQAYSYNDLLLSQKLVKTYSIVLQSDTVLNKVIASLALDIKANDIRSSLSVSGVSDTEVLKVSYTSSDPQMAADVVNKIVVIAPDEIIRTAKVGSVEVVDRAIVPESPVKPQKMQNTLIAAIIGSILATGFIFLRELLDNTFKTEDELKERYNLPVLGVLPLYRSDAKVTSGTEGEAR